MWLYRNSYVLNSPLFIAAAIVFFCICSSIIISCNNFHYATRYTKFLRRLWSNVYMVILIWNCTLYLILFYCEIFLCCYCSQHDDADREVLAEEDGELWVLAVDEDAIDNFFSSNDLLCLATPNRRWYHTNPSSLCLIVCETNILEIEGKRKDEGEAESQSFRVN